MRQMVLFYQVMYHSSGVLRAPHVKSVADFLRYLFQDRKLQPSTIVGYRSAIADRLEICPSMKISLVSWIASTETDPKGNPPPGTSPWFFAPADKVHLNQLKASLKHLTFKAVSLLAWVRASLEVRYMLGKQPSTIDAYRSPIVDKLGNSLFNIRKDKNLARLLDSFLRDRPKGRSGIPSWNFSLAMHQLRLLLIQSRSPP